MESLWFLEDQRSLEIHSSEKEGEREREEGEGRNEAGTHRNIERLG